MFGLDNSADFYRGLQIDFGMFVLHLDSKLSWLFQTNVIMHGNVRLM
jgi:hypothetical protein